MRVPRSVMPAAARTASTQGPEAFTTTRAPSRAVWPLSRSRAATPATAPRASRVTSSTWQ